MRQRIRRISKLIYVKAARNFLGQSRGHVLIIFGVAASHVRARDPHFGAESFDVRDFFLRHLVWDHEQDAIAFGTGHERETQTGVPCSGLNDSATRLQFSVGLSRFDH